MSTQLLYDNDHLSQKADVKELLALNEIKINRFDTEALMRCFDIQHKQITHLIVLFVEAIETVINNKKRARQAP